MSRDQNQPVLGSAVPSEHYGKAWKAGKKEHRQCALCGTSIAPDEWMRYHYGAGGSTTEHLDCDHPDQPSESYRRWEEGQRVVQERWLAGVQAMEEEHQRKLRDDPDYLTELARRQVLRELAAALKEGERIATRRWSEKRWRRFLTELRQQIDERIHKDGAS